MNITWNKDRTKKNESQVKPIILINVSGNKTNKGNQSVYFLHTLYVE